MICLHECAPQGGTKEIRIRHRRHRLFGRRGRMQAFTLIAVKITTNPRCIRSRRPIFAPNVALSTKIDRRRTPHTKAPEATAQARKPERSEPLSYSFRASARAKHPKMPRTHCRSTSETHSAPGGCCRSAHPRPNPQHPGTQLRRQAHLGRPRPPRRRAGQMLPPRVDPRGRASPHRALRPALHRRAQSQRFYQRREERTQRAEPLCLSLARRLRTRRNRRPRG